MLQDVPYLDKVAAVTVHRRYLPHWHQEGKMQFVTFRLFDSLPQTKLCEIRSRREAWLAAHPKPWNERTLARYRACFSQAIDDYLDNGYGCCVLKHKPVADAVAGALDFYNGDRYVMHSYVVMPNHVHLLVEPMPGHEVGELLRSWRGFSTRQINRILNRTGRIWQDDYHDRLIRNEQHYRFTQAYIARNYESGGVLYYKA